MHAIDMELIVDYTKLTIISLRSRNTKYRAYIENNKVSINRRKITL